MKKVILASSGMFDTPAMNKIPQCSKDLPKNIAQTIRNLGKQWNSSSINPKINRETMNKWNDLIDAWLSATDIPIIVRKGGGLRGSEIKHKTGRRIIISDNSPAQWVCYRALLNEVPMIEEIRDLLIKDRLPISFAVKKAENGAIKYRRTLGKYSINKYGWELCHIKPVGINTQGDISQIDIKILNQSFLNLMKPINFFLLPLKWGSLGELQEFIEGMTQ